ncbi:MAG: hypothetical protein PHD21_05905 [Flavobacteriales bacterium]|nr:hypothetical protein [Flavobacteriales bacterium]
MGEKEFEKERVKEVIAECFIKGYTKAKTMERVLNVTGEKLYLKKLNVLLEEIMQAWSGRKIMDSVTLIAVELKKIDTREGELWQAWEESKALDEGGGDARYLAELRRCADQRTKLLGLTAKDGKNKSKETVVWNEKKNYGTNGKTN